MGNMIAEFQQGDTVKPGQLDVRTSDYLAEAEKQITLTSDSGDPAIALERARRDNDFAAEAAKQGIGQTPTAAESAPDERLTALEEQAKIAKSETEKWKALYGRSENKVGEVRRRLSELENRVQAQPAYVDARQITGRGGDEVLSAQEVTNLLMSMANAFGNQIRQAKEEAIWLAQNPDANQPHGVPAAVEAELLESHPWLANLTAMQKERAMMDLIGTKPNVDTAEILTGQKPAPQPVAPSKPPVATERERARVREAAFIETSNRGSAAERTAVAPAQQAENERLAKLREAISKPGGAAIAEKLLADLGAGVGEDANTWR